MAGVMYLFSCRLKHALVCSELRVGLVASLPMSCHSAVNICTGVIFLLVVIVLKKSNNI